MKKPTNIHVSMSQVDSRNVSAGWEMDGARFHVWFDPKTMEIEGGWPRRDAPTLYKNPPNGTDRNDPAFFDTRKLNAKSKANAEILEIVFQEIKEKDLIGVARKEAQQREDERQAEQREFVRQENIKKAAPRILSSLRDTLALIRPEDVESLIVKDAFALLRELGEME